MHTQTSEGCLNHQYGIKSCAREAKTCLYLLDEWIGSERRYNKLRNITLDISSRGKFACSLVAKIQKKFKRDVIHEIMTFRIINDTPEWTAADATGLKRKKKKKDDNGEIYY